MIFYRYRVNLTVNGKIGTENIYQMLEMELSEEKHLLLTANKARFGL